MSPKEALAGRNLGQDFSGKEGWSMYHGNPVLGFSAHPDHARTHGRDPEVCFASGWADGRVVGAIASLDHLKPY